MIIEQLAFASSVAQSCAVTNQLLHAPVALLHHGLLGAPLACGPLLRMRFLGASLSKFAKVESSLNDVWGPSKEPSFVGTPGYWSLIGVRPWGEMCSKVFVEALLILSIAVL